MKRLGLAVLAAMSIVCSAQTSIPSKMLKGIDTELDEFTHTTTYSSKGCPLSVVCVGDSVSLRVALSVAAYDAPVGLEKILVLSDGHTTEIADTTNFKMRENSQRTMTGSSSGRFGTSSYKGAQFGSRAVFFEEWNADAAPWLSLVESIAINPSKVRFVGRNQSVDHEFSGKDQKKMVAILALYHHLKGE